jgi:hypothetical protein
MSGELLNVSPRLGRYRPDAEEHAGILGAAVASRSRHSSSGTVMKCHGAGPFQNHTSPVNSKFIPALAAELQDDPESLGQIGRPAKLLRAERSASAAEVQPPHTRAGILRARDRLREPQPRAVGPGQLRR